jgi:hypothetical protein
MFSYHVYIKNDVFLYILCPFDNTVLISLIAFLVFCASFYILQTEIYFLCLEG